MIDTTELWNRYTQTGNRQARETLILSYSRLVHYVVGRVAMGLPSGVDKDDLMGDATLGLIEAVDHFDPTRGLKFETYATSRIRGRILDALRKTDLLPRSARRHAKELERAVTRLTQTLGRRPTDTEMAVHLDISEAELHQWMLDANCVIVSLDQPQTNGDGETTLPLDLLEDTTMLTPSAQLDTKETKKQLTASITSLSRQEQLVIALYYNDELTMKEIGQVLGVSESRVSQIHAKAMLTLRGLMRDDATTTAHSFVYNGRGNHVPVHANVA